MPFISNVMDGLPFAIIVPIAILLAILPIVRVVADVMLKNKSNNREMLVHIVNHLEKYDEDQNRISAFFIEEAARSFYGKALSLAEILFFLDQDKPSDKLFRYSIHKPLVEVNAGVISLIEPNKAICKHLNFSRKEITGYLRYLFYSFSGVIFAMITPPPPLYLWSVVKWLSVTFLIGYAISRLIKADRIRDARKYVESTQPDDTAN